MLKLFLNLGNDEHISYEVNIILASWLIGVTVCLLKKTPLEKENGFAMNIIKL